MLEDATATKERFQLAKAQVCFELMLGRVLILLTAALPICFAP